MIAPVSVARSTMPLRALLDGVAERVGQDQAALGVGVVHLDRLAVHRGDDVARLHRVPLGMFSVDGTTAVSVRGSPSVGDRAHGLDHRGAARHVELHLLHLRRGLDRDPAGVEGHGLAHVAEVRARPRPWGGSAARSAAAPRGALGHRGEARPCRGPRSRRGRAARARAPRARRRSRGRARRGTSGVATLDGQVLEVARGVLRPRRRSRARLDLGDVDVGRRRSRATRRRRRRRRSPAST